ncbi:uncharacterized protein LOC114366599 [Ostrinia furnacalis]|uniref:uncharacterized protein LOC114366599 n=1 Tax=Ostrinia furnacalis TaxID=93504 RepID=UPI00103D93C5|nr:uncharacterized protein LOC114366599 [Ostrinia furnacalis]
MDPHNIQQRNILEKVLARVAEKLYIQRWRYEVKNAMQDIVNYVGCLIPVMLIDDSRDVTIPLMIKLNESHTVPEMDHLFRGAYNREVYVYSTLVPLFKKYANVPEDFFPSCFYAESTNDRVLALHDMTIDKFERYNKGRFLDEDHLTLTLEAVAKLHSFSFILKELNKLKCDEIMEPFSTQNQPHFAKSLKGCFKKYGVDMFQGTKHEKFFIKMYKTMDNMTVFFDEPVTKAHSLIYGHGDLYKENLLFKYSNEKPVQVCLLDYQLTHLMSPAYDFVLLIMNSIDSIVRKRHYHIFLSTYYNTLERSLRAKGVDANKVYSKENFNEDIKVVFSMCFGMIIYSFTLWLDLEGMESLVDPKGIDPEDKKDEVELFKKIIGDVVTDFRNFGVYS